MREIFTLTGRVIFTLPVNIMRNIMKLFVYSSILISCAILIFNCKVVFGEEDVDSQTSIVVLSIPSTCHLSILNPDQTKTLSQDGTAESAFEAGYTEFDSGAPTLIVSSNKNWKLSARSSGFNNNDGYIKATEDLQIKDLAANHVKDSFNNYKSLSDIDQEITSYSGGVKEENHPCQYRVLLDWTKDIPGTYTATVTFTLTTQP